MQNNNLKTRILSRLIQLKFNEKVYAQLLQAHTPSLHSKERLTAAMNNLKLFLPLMFAFAIISFLSLSGIIIISVVVCKYWRSLDRFGLGGGYSEGYRYDGGIRRDEERDEGGREREGTWRWCNKGGEGKRVEGDAEDDERREGKRSSWGRRVRREERGREREEHEEKKMFALFLHLYILYNIWIHTYSLFVRSLLFAEYVWKSRV